MNKKHSTLFAFCLVTSLFFLWGFAHNLDPILIPHLKKSFGYKGYQVNTEKPSYNPSTIVSP